MSNNRKTANINNRTAILLFISLALTTLSSCVDDFFDRQGEKCPEGEPARISVTVDTGNMRVLTRGDMQQGLDNLVSDLWVAVYNVSTGQRTGLTVVGDINENLDHDFRKVDIEALSGDSYIVGVANATHRYASADDSGKLIPLQEALQNADTWDKFRAISAAFDSEGNCVTDAPLNAPVMSGTFTSEEHKDGSQTENQIVSIYPGISTPSGAVHLRRLISQVKFNVGYNKANIKSFEVKSWKVVNIPTHAWLLEREEGQNPVNAIDTRPAGSTHLYDTPDMTDFEAKGDTYTFDFWQLENKREGRMPPEGSSPVEAYRFREKEYKNEDGSNSGRFVSLVDNRTPDAPNNNATYVVMNVVMEMLKDENGDDIGSVGVSHRLVETQYLVHLGYVEGDAMKRATDFNCRRNSRYTYNITVNNVNDLLVEAKAETADGEINPAVEGFVTDITDSYYNVDCHYACMNIYLSSEDIKSFEYYISAYDLEGREVTINSLDPSTVPAAGSKRYMYMNWVELRPTSSQTVLARYKPAKGTNADGQTFTLDKIKGNASMKAGWYTMFINEYVYEEGELNRNPEDADYGNETGSTAWQGYVNRPDRRVWLNVEGSVSADGKSMYYKSKYAVSQSSIQTYYNDEAKLALGVEHDNESLGLTLRNSFNPFRNSSGSQVNINTSPGRNRAAGRYNIAQYIAGSTGTGLTWRNDNYQWSNHINVTSPQTVNAVNNQGVVLAARDATNPIPLPEIRTATISESQLSNAMIRLEPDYGSRARKYIEAITACLNRNRDNDGDGRIDASELRWFVPTAAQYVRIILGRRSLSDPIFDPGDMTRLSNNTGTNNGQNSRLLAYSSDGRMMWLMEGLSFSEYRQWPSDMSTPWQVRCVRNLGANNSIISSTPSNSAAFVRREGTNIIDMKYYEDKSIRKEAYYSSSMPMPVHHINDQRYNRCYRSFEFFDSVIGLNDKRLELNGKTIEWSSYLKSKNPCRILDYTGKKGWRVPNQKELTILGILGVSNLNLPSGNVYQVSCSYSFFDFSGYTPGANPTDPVSGGSITSQYRFPMKIVSSSGQSTQSESMNNIVVNSAYFGIRCVRDVTD